MVRTSDSDPIKVDFVDLPYLPNRRFGMTFCPGKFQPQSQSGGWSRDLEKDLLRLRDTYNVQRLLACIEDWECEELQVRQMQRLCQQLGIDLSFLPIKDGGVPDSVQVIQLQQDLPWLLESSLPNGFTVIFCKGGLGRTGLITSCLLRELGLNAKNAISLVRQARPGTIETRAQEAFVENYNPSNIAQKLPSPYFYNPNGDCSSHGWGDERNSYTFEQLLQKVQLGETKDFLLRYVDQPNESYLADPLTPIFASKFLIEKLYKKTAQLNQYIRLPYPIKIGQYRIAVHAICATMLGSRAETKGILILYPQAFQDSRRSGHRQTVSYFECKQRLEQLDLLLGEGKVNCGESRESLTPGTRDQILLAGPLEKSDAVSLAMELHQSSILFTGTLEMTNLIVLNI